VTSDEMRPELAGVPTVASIIPMPLTYATAPIVLD
jgi:hypothetical protein